jgi:hypothetical protein
MSKIFAGLTAAAVALGYNYSELGIPEKVGTLSKAFHERVVGAPAMKPPTLSLTSVNEFPDSNHDSPIMVFTDQAGQEYLFDCDTLGERLADELVAPARDQDAANRIRTLERPLNLYCSHKFI